ncbi:MAG TPA: DNA N-6-adenine-methyltransferase [Candidatus Acidoferrales bacterium]|nr:DNA N-6-adenine-methyltransferase [Candidatus Acidoferrales bacterium]
MRKARGGKGFAHERGSQGETNDWLTPKYIIEEIGPFHLDPCAAPNPRPWDTAKRHITFPEDGFSAKWEGRVFCNPPYGPDTGKWMKKMGDHGSGIALIFARTETSAWQEWVWPFAEGILFLRGRVQFHKPDGALPKDKNGSGSPSALVAFSPADAELLRLSSLGGAFVHAIGRYPDPTDIPVIKLTGGQDYEWEKIFTAYLDEGWSDKDADKLTWLDMQNKFPGLLGNRFHQAVSA